MRTPRDVERIEVDDADEIGIGAGPLTLVAPDSAAGQRLDKALALLLPDISRSRLQQWIDDGAVRVNGAAARVRQALAGGERIDILPPPAPAQLAMRPCFCDLRFVPRSDRFTERPGLAVIVTDQDEGAAFHMGRHNQPAGGGLDSVPGTNNSPSSLRGLP